MKVLATDEFLKELKRVPTHIYDLYKKQETIFINNWKDPRLHSKKLKGGQTFSFRVTRHYRVIFIFQEDFIVFVSIGHRKDIYN